MQAIEQGTARSTFTSLALCEDGDEALAEFNGVAGGEMRLFGTGEVRELRIRGVVIRTDPNADVLEALTRLIDAKKVVPVVSQVLPLGEVAKSA